MKEKIMTKIKHTESLHEKALCAFINTNTRRDRDRFLRYRYKLEVYNEILAML